MTEHDQSPNEDDRNVVEHKSGDSQSSEPQVIASNFDERAAQNDVIPKSAIRDWIWNNHPYIQILMLISIFVAVLFLMQSSRFRPSQDRSTIGPVAIKTDQNLASTDRGPTNPSIQEATGGPPGVPPKSADISAQPSVEHSSDLMTKAQFEEWLTGPDSDANLADLLKREAVKKALREAINPEGLIDQTKLNAAMQSAVDAKKLVVADELKAIETKLVTATVDNERQKLTEIMKQMYETKKDGTLQLSDSFLSKIGAGAMQQLSTDQGNMKSNIASMDSRYQRLEDRIGILLRFGALSERKQKVAVCAFESEDNPLAAYADTLFQLARAPIWFSMWKGYDLGVANCYDTPAPYSWYREFGDTVAKKAGLRPAATASVPNLAKFRARGLFGDGVNTDTKVRLIMVGSAKALAAPPPEFQNECKEIEVSIVLIAHRGEADQAYAAWATWEDFCTRQEGQAVLLLAGETVMSKPLRDIVQEKPFQSLVLRRIEYLLFPRGPYITSPTP